MPNESEKGHHRAIAMSPGRLRAILITLGVTLLALIVFYLLRRFATTVLLVFAGVLLAVFLDGLAAVAVKYLHWRRGLALGLVVLVLLGATAAFIWLAGPAVVQQSEALMDQLPHSAALLQENLQQSQWGRDLLGRLPSLPDVQFSFASVLGSVSQAFSITMEVLGAFVFILFLGLYLAATPRQYVEGGLMLLARAHRDRGREVLAALGRALRWWLLGRAVTMTLMGVLTTVALKLADIPLALVLGVIAGLLLFIPYLGAVISAIPAMLIGLMESPARALLVGAIYLGVHVFEGYCVTPFVQKRAVALPPALLLSVQVLAAALFGPLGVIFSTPLMVVAIVLLQTLYVHDVLGEEVAVLGDHQ